MLAIYISFLPELSLFIIISVRVSRAVLQGNYPNSRLHANLFASYFSQLGNNELTAVLVAFAKGTSVHKYALPRAICFLCCNNYSNVVVMSHSTVYLPHYLFLPPKQ